ncbi:MAG: methionyl-tRNA formyltransferase [Candidatus Dojkabacteria bacterium]
MQKRVKCVFLGSSWESVETLKALHQDKRFNVVGVITGVDKPVGRKQILTPFEVKKYALDSGIEVFHTEKNVDRYQKAIEIFKPELVVCKAFGELIPKFFLEYPKYKAINIHFSLLPKYRGAVPIQKAILEGEKETGISIMLMTEKLDEGDILEVFKEPILPTDTNLSLRTRLVKKNAEVIGDVLMKWINGEISPKKQDHNKATYCWQPDISKEKAEIRWEEMEPEYIERLTRAMIPWPVAWTRLHNGKTLKLFSVQLLPIQSSLAPGTLHRKNNMLLLSTKDPNLSIRVLDAQIEGKKRMNERDLLNGLPLNKNA